MVELIKEISTVIAFAPATCANVAVGFDLLGFAFGCVGDQVTLKRTASGVRITEIESEQALPMEIEKNVASAVILKVLAEYEIEAGFDISIKKGVALGSGMGGSAASSVAALIALNGFLKAPLEISTLANFAVHGERIASGNAHPDNVVPCLYGGLTLINGVNPIKVVRLPLPNVYCVLVHPNLRLDTRRARGILPESMTLASYVAQTRNLAGFLASLYTDDLSLLAASLKDVLIEPHRAQLVKGFNEVKAAALKAGALGASLSGSGPSIFAFARNEELAKSVEAAMLQAFAKVNVKAQSWLGLIDTNGARVCSTLR